MPVVTVYFNLHPDRFFGYKHGHSVQKVFSYEAPSEGDLIELAEAAFDAFTLPLRLLDEAYRLVAEQYRAAGHRSLTVGDVLQIDHTWLACMPDGWVELEQAPVEVPGE